MLNKNIVLLGIILSVGCLYVASLLYPGGSQGDVNSIGFHWTENYISDMLEFKAVNGEENDARPFAVIGAVLMGLSTAFAFVRFSKKVDSKNYSVVLKYGGWLLMLFSVLVTVPSMHLSMVNGSIIVNLLVLFYVTVALLKSPLKGLGVLSAVFLAIFYGVTYMFTARASLEYMPLMQKVTHIIQIAWVLGLEYLTKKEDFKHLT